MAKKSAGILLYRARAAQLEVLLVHPGGPFWVKKDMGSWTIPKGELHSDEEPLAAAIREFKEETGYQPAGKFLSLGTILQRGGKEVAAWAVKGDLDPASLVSNTFELEWPPRSGKKKAFPEVDRAAWFTPEEARQYINEKQIPLLERLEALLR